MKTNCACMQGLVFLVGTLLLGLVQCCDVNQIQVCSNNFAADVGGTDTSALVSEDAINSVCGSAYPVFKNCLRRASSGCPAAVTSSFEGMFTMFEFVCNDGREDAIKYGECVGSAAVKNKIASCQATMTNSLQSNIYASATTKCGYIEDMLDCVKGGVQTNCGADAAAYQDKINRMGVGPVAETIGCDIDVAPPSSNNNNNNNDDVLGDDNHNNNNNNDRYEQPGGSNRQSNNDNDDDTSGSPSISGNTMGWILGCALLLQWLIFH